MGVKGRGRDGYGEGGFNGGRNWVERGFGYGCDIGFELSHWGLGRGIADLSWVGIGWRLGVD